MGYYDARYNRDVSGDYAITEQGDLGLGLTPITEDTKDQDNEREKVNDDK